MKPLRLADITDNVVIIKINKLFHNGMSELELYETTRGIWKRKIESVEKADYALAVYKGIVIEVYKITNWAKAGTYPMQTRQIDPKRCKDRIEFIGTIAEQDARGKYIGRDVSPLFKYGEANPVKTIFQ